MNKDDPLFGWLPNRDVFYFLSFKFKGVENKVFLLSKDSFFWGYNPKDIFLKSMIFYGNLIYGFTYGFYLAIFLFGIIFYLIIVGGLILDYFYLICYFYFLGGFLVVYCLGALF